MLLFLEWRSLIEIFSQLRLQWRKNLTQNYQTLPLPQRRINFVRFVYLLFFMCDSFSEEGCHVVTSKSNSEETVCSCNHLTHFAVLMDYDGSKKVTKLFLPYSIILWAQWTNLILSLNFSFFDTAHRGGRNNSENYHLRGTEPFHRRDTFNINTLLLPHVCNVPEYWWRRFSSPLN